MDDELASGIERAVFGAIGRDNIDGWLSRHLRTRLGSDLSRVVFSSFQFKRTHQFVERMTFAPPNLADRIDTLFTLAPAAAVIEIEQLVGEILALVEQHAPDVDSTVLRRRPGERPQPWMTTSMR